MKIQIDFLKYEYENIEASRWITKVRVQIDRLTHVSDEEFTVYADSEWLEVWPSGTAKRSKFKWNDWALANANGSVEAASCIVALLVAVDDLNCR